MLSFTLLIVVGSCSRAEDGASRSLSEFCNGVELARIEYAGHLKATKRKAEHAVSDEEHRVEACARMIGSLDATEAYLSGLDRHYALASAATNDAAIHIKSESLLPSVSDAMALCRMGRLEGLNQLLSKIEGEIEADFDEQLQACKERGWASMAAP